VALSNKEVEGRTMNVSVAKEKPDRSGAGFLQRRNDNRRW